MAEHERSKKSGQDEAIKFRKNTNESENLKEQDSVVSSLENPASFLCSDRLSHPTGATQRAEILSGLQQSHGNAYVQRLITSQKLQAKLSVTPPDDQYEKEADRVAEAVVQSPERQVQRQPLEEEEEMLQPKRDDTRYQDLQRQPLEEEEEELMAKRAEGQDIQVLQRQVEPEEEEEEETIQPKRQINRTPAASQDLETQINSARGSGQALPDSLRASFEPQLGHDFSGVRVHTDSQADSLSRQLGARAFTTGQDIFFQGGDYQPHSSEGQKLLGHEMTHVVQQGAAPLASEAIQTAREGDREEREGAVSELVQTRDRFLTQMSRANIQAFLRQAALCQQLGADDQARDALDRAADQAISDLKEHTRAFNVETSSRRAARDLLDQIALVQLVGEEGAEEAIEKALHRLLEWAESQLAGAVRQLQASPGETTAQQVLERAALVQMLGGDASSALSALRAWSQERESG